MHVLRERERVWCKLIPGKCYYSPNKTTLSERDCRLMQVGLQWDYLKGYPEHEAVSGQNIIKKLQPRHTADTDKFTQKSELFKKNQKKKKLFFFLGTNK